MRSRMHDRNMKTEKTKEILFEVANLHFNRHDYARAIQVLEGMSLTEPDSAARLLLAKAYQRNLDFEKAQAELRAIESGMPGGYSPMFLFDLYRELGDHFFTRKDYAQSAAYFEKAMHYCPADPQTALMLARSHAFEKQTYKALWAYKKAFRTTETRQVASAEMYELYRENKKYACALRHFEKRGLASKTEAEQRQECDTLYHALFYSILHTCAERPATKQWRLRKFIERIPDDAAMLKNMAINEQEIVEKKTVLSSKVRSLTVSLTNACNIRCIMCSSRNDEPWAIPESTLREINSLFPYIEKIIWQGGEALLYHGIEKLMDDASHYPLQQVVFTNGMLLTDALIEKLLRWNVNINLSVDGVTREVYEKIHSGSSFEYILRVLGHLREARKRIKTRSFISLYVVIMKSNYHQLADFADFAHQYRFDEIVFNPLIAGPWCAPEEIFTTAGEANARRSVDQLAQEVSQRCARYGIKLVNGLPNETYRAQTQKNANATRQGGVQEAGSAVPSNTPVLFPACAIPWQRLFIDIHGDVKPSCLCMHPIGNLKEATLESLWNGDAMRMYREKIRSGTHRDFCAQDCISGRVAPELLRYI